MRLAPTRSTLTRRQPRRPHVVALRVSAARQLELTAERRWREAGGPEDRATYECECGMEFLAAVSTSVACPRCGVGQAW